MMNSKTKIKTVLAITFLLFTLTSTKADTTNIKKNPPSINKATVVKEKSSKLSTADTLSANSNSSIGNQKVIFEQQAIGMTESEAYKMLYNNAKENNDKMVSTVQWVIGISIAFLLALLGTQIFFNWRINKKEIDYIKKDIDEKIGELKAELVRDLGKTNKEHITEISTTLDKIEKAIQLKIDENFDKKSKLAELADKMRDKELELIRKEVNNEIKRVKIDIEKNSGDLWRLKGVDSNALSSFSQAALLKLEIGHETKYVLDEIIEVLGKMTEISLRDYELLDDLILKLDAKHPDKKSKIISLYKDKPVYKFVDRTGQGIANYLGFDFPTIEYIKNKCKLPQSWSI